MLGLASGKKVRQLEARIAAWEDEARSAMQAYEVLFNKYLDRLEQQRGLLDESARLIQDSPMALGQAVIKELEALRAADDLAAGVTEVVTKFMASTSPRRVN